MSRNISLLPGIHLKKSTTNLIDKKILQNPNTKLDEILTEDVFMQELKNKNQNLIKYLNKDRLKEIINYIIYMPTVDDPIRGHKLPYICSQILSMDDKNITKYFLKTNTELEQEKFDEAEIININEVKSPENTETVDIFRESITNMNFKYQRKRRQSKILKKKRRKKMNSCDVISKEKYNNENRIELLDYALSFLATEEELNYVLCGYFSAFMKNLINVNQAIITTYMFNERKDILKKMVYHSYRQSISDILLKLMLCEEDKDELNINDFDKARMDILEDSIIKMDLIKDSEQISSIASFVSDIINETEFFEKILENKNIINYLITNKLKNLDITSTEMRNFILVNQRKNFGILIDVIIKWVNTIFDKDLKTPFYSEDGKLNHTLLSEELFKILPQLIEKNFNKKDNKKYKEKSILLSYDDTKLIPLGIYRIKIVELLGNLFPYFKHISKIYDKLLIETKFFENAFNYLFEYEFNNLYQDALLFLFKKFLNDSNHHEILAEHLFKKLDILSIIINNLKDTDDIYDNKVKFKYKSGNFTNHGYLSFLISLSYKINIIIGGEPLKINNTISREGSISFMTRTAPPVEKEEIDAFYGIDANDLYDEVSQDSNEKNKKVNHPIENMEKYFTDDWKNFFNEHIKEKIKLYETKLCKDVKRETIFRNPFMLEDNANDENLYEDVGEEDLLSKEVKEAKRRNSQENFDEINVMNLEKDNKNGNKIRGSMSKKMLIDEVEKEENKKNEDMENKEEDEDVLGKLKKSGFKKGDEDNKNEKKENINSDVDVLRRFDKSCFKKKEDKNDEDNKKENDENEDEDVLGKFKRIRFNNKDEKNVEKNENDENEDEDVLGKLKKVGFKKEEDKSEEKDKKEEDKMNEENEDEDVLAKFKKNSLKKENDNNQENEDEDVLGKFKKNTFKKENDKIEENEDEDILSKFKKDNFKKENENNEENEDEDVLGKFKKDTSKKENDNNEENEDEDVLGKFKKNTSKKENEDEDVLAKFKKNSFKKENNIKEENEDEDILGKFKKNGFKKENDIKEEDKTNEEEEDEDILGNFNKNGFKKENNKNEKNEDEDVLSKFKKRSFKKEDKKKEEEEDEDILSKFNKKNLKKLDNKKDEDDDEDILSKFKKRSFKSDKEEEKNKDKNDIYDDDDNFWEIGENHEAASEYLRRLRKKTFEDL